MGQDSNSFMSVTSEKEPHVFLIQIVSVHNVNIVDNHNVHSGGKKLSAVGGHFCQMIWFGKYSSPTRPTHVAKMCAGIGNLQ